MRLLIVNDEELTANTMKENIHWNDYGVDEVFVAYNTEAARNCIEAVPIDILLCDIEMPGENGLSLLRWVRENRKNIECIFLTCHASFAYAQEAISLGCQDYILIPAKYETIGQVVQKVVKMVENRKEDSRLREYGATALRKVVDETNRDAALDTDCENQIDAIKQYIHDNLGDDALSVALVAEHFSFHPVYLNRVFKKQTNTSLSQYINDSRMLLARRLLEAGKLSAEVVAKRVGYNNYPSFSTAFKKYYGCSPSSISKKK